MSVDDPLDAAFYDDEEEEVGDGDGDELEEEEDYDETEEPGRAEQWPKLDSCRPYAAHEPLVLGANRRDSGQRVEGSIYPAMAELNANVNQYLREYQRDGVKWLWNKYVKGTGGILGDEMGLGKTVQIAAFLSAVLGKTATSDDKARTFPLAADDYRIALVVVPASTIPNWKRELATWGHFKVRTALGSEKEGALRSALGRDCEVVLTTYDTLRSQIGDFKRVTWDVTIWDEAHLMKNKDSARSVAARAIACRRRFGLTGTPMSNKYVELWVLFDWCSNGQVGEKSHFNQYYAKELGNGFKKNAKQWELMRRLSRQKELKKLLDEWMLQRFKSIIAHEMPKKRDHIVFCRLAAEQEEVNMRVLESTPRLTPLPTPLPTPRLTYLPTPLPRSICGSSRPPTTKSCSRPMSRATAARATRRACATRLT